jgi:hypothetical protein
MAPPPENRISPLAAVLAWLWPGLGHISLGERRRGFLIMFGVLFLFVTGLLVGGIDCVDRRHDRLWFLAQSVCGPIALGTDLVNQRFIQRLPADWRQRPAPPQRDDGRSPQMVQELDWRPGRDPELLERYAESDTALLAAQRRIGLGRASEMGTLFIALAGLMNLVVILDALYARAPAPDPTPPPQPTPSRDTGSADP